MLPRRGYPFGPGGYGGLLLFFCHFQIRANDAAAQSDAASRASLLIMSKGRLGRGSAGGESSVSSVQPLFYTRLVSGNAEEPYPAGWSSERRTFHCRLNSVDACSHSVVLNGLTVASVWRVSLPLELSCLNNSLC